jgi:hypothetical protein
VDPLHVLEMDLFVSGFLRRLPGDFGFACGASPKCSNTRPVTPFFAAALLRVCRGICHLLGTSVIRPKSGAMRFTLAIFLFMNLYMVVLLFSAVRLAILSSRTALNGYGPFILLTALGSPVLYVIARWRLETISESTTAVGRK